MKNTKSFPIQKLPMSKKNQDWKEACVDYIIGAGESNNKGNGRTRSEEMQTYYDLYNSIYNEKDLKYVTNPFKQDDGFPATAQDYNIIKSYIDQLLGEETKRPFNFQVCRTSNDAVSEVQDKAKQMLIDYIQASIMSKMGPEQQQQYQQALESGEIQTPEQIEKYITKDYKDIAETTAYHTLEYLKRKLNITHEFFKGWKDGLIAGEEIYYVGINNGEPTLERVNPLYFRYENAADIEFIHDASWCCRKMIMSPTEIYDRFYDKMDEKQLNELLELIDEKPGAGLTPEIRKSSLDYEHIKLHKMNSFTDNPFDTDQINVWHCCWKSFKKIGFVSVINPETGEVEEYTVDEDYKETGEEINVEWKWIIEVWEGYRIGDTDNLYVGVQPLEYQHVSADNPNSQFLPYTGVIYNNTNSTPKSLVSMMKPLQYMYIVVWYRLELAMSRDKGKVPVIDVTQIPKSMGIDVNKWMHYLGALGVAFINPYEEGWCFAPNTKVIMADGSLKEIKDIKLFDSILTPSGNKELVTKLFKGTDEMYDIIPHIGSEKQTITADHIVRYIYRDTWTNKTEIRLDKAKDLLLKFKQNPKYREHCYLERASNIDDWYSKPILDPYLLGLWLGDGTTGSPEIESADYEVIQYLQDYADTHDLKTNIRASKQSKSFSIYLSSIYNNHSGYAKKNPLIEQLRNLSIYNRKDIPDEYIYTTVENRLKLLAGLIDTDGSVYHASNNRTGYIEFTQCSERKNIVDKFVFIARSLGFKVSVKKLSGKPCMIHNNRHITIPQDYYRVRIFDGEYDIPTLIARKKIHLQSGRTYSKNLTTFNIKYNGVGEYNGFAIDDENHEFLLSDFTIVHNCIPGREGGKAASFNQFQAWDLSMSNVIDQYVNLMSKIEDMVAKLTGITPQRQGQIAPSELVSNANQAVTMSYHITEPWFWLHNQVKRNVLNMLLNTAKSAWKDNKQCLNYILDDATRAFLTLSDKFFYEDMDVFVEDSTKNRQDIDALRQLLQPAMQNGATLLDVAEIITMDNVNMIKNRLADIEEKRIQQQQQQQELEQQNQQQLIQMQNEVKEEELMLREAELDLQKYKIDQDNQTKMAVAELNAMRGIADSDANDNGIPDVAEMAKNEIERLKISQAQQSKDLDSMNKMKEAQMKDGIEKKKIDLENKKLETQVKLQQMSDKAAMEREQLKARTALKNKVVGESKSKK